MCIINLFGIAVMFNKRLVFKSLLVFLKYIFQYLFMGCLKINAEHDRAQLTCFICEFLK